MVVDSIDVNDSSGSKANVALIQNLHAGGFEVTVYHYTRRDIQLSGITCYSIPEIRYSPLYFISRLQRVLQRNSKLNLAPFMEGLFGFSFTFFNDTNSILRALRKMTHEPDLVITLSKGASFRPHYAMLKCKTLHRKWLAYIHDPYPFHYYPRPYNWVESSYKAKEVFFENLAKKAKYSGFPSLLLQEWMGSYFPDFLRTGHVIPHQNTHYQITDVNFPSYFDLSNFNLLHAGNLMKQRSPEGLINGFNLFLQRHPDARVNSRLLLLGPASYHAALLGKFKDVPEIYIQDENIAFDLVYKLQMNATVNIILESKAEISPFLPAKFPHCIEADKPILLLGPYYSETRRLLGVDYPYYSEADDINGIANHISALYVAWQRDPAGMALGRTDLQHYLSAAHLKDLITNL